MKRIQIEGRGHFIGGAWITDGALFDNRAPQDLEHVVSRHPEGAQLVDEAVAAANRAQVRWDAEPLERRIEVIEAFAAELAGASDRIAEVIVGETGKTIGAARGEAGALAKKAALTIELARTELQPDVFPDVGYVALRPLGVFGVIGPFNFPVHLSNGHILPALLAGNAAILKPSETAPASAQLYVEAWERAASAVGADAALLQLVQGGGQTGAALVGHDDVHGVAFTGSYKVGVAIRRQTAHQTGKLLALEMGGKNTAIVLEDADIASAAGDIAGAAYVMCGQRCTATSRIVAHAAVADALAEELADRVRTLVVGDPFEETSDLGPLATTPAAELFWKWQNRTEGIETLVAAELPSGLPAGSWVAPSLHRVVDRTAAMERDQTEIFGPETLLHVGTSLEDIVSLANATPYGLAMSVHTESEDRFESIRPRLQAGLVNWNRGTAGASSLLPFGGIKHSGNHRPAGSWALRYMTYPQAVLRG
ncbi:MAG: succinylglutamic semialdehyde dehydrogenase [Bradymonadia bacterium]|jgi:succinylglutamic semialdehyde dehydrogenase